MARTIVVLNVFYFDVPALVSCPIIHIIVPMISVKNTITCVQVNQICRVLQVKVSQELKHAHAEQLSKLNVKHQTDCDLLEDLRWGLREQHCQQGFLLSTSCTIKKKLKASIGQCFASEGRIQPGSLQYVSLRFVVLTLASFICRM